MVNDDKRDFLASLGAIFEMFGQEGTGSRFELYWMALRDAVTLPEAKHAMSIAIRSASRVPTVAELLEHVEGKAEDRAIAAWADVQKAASVSYMDDLDFEDRTINAVIRNLHGRPAFFARLCGGTESEKWLRIEFMKVYAAVARGGVGDEASALLAGEADRGLVMGRLHEPNVQRIACDQNRAALLPPRQVTIEHRRQTVAVPRLKEA